MWYTLAQVMFVWPGWCSKPLWTASHISIWCIQSVLEHWHAVDGHIGTPLHCYACEGRGWILGKLGYGVHLSPSDVCMAWLMLQTPVDCIPHLYWMYTKCFRTLTCCGWAYWYTFTLLCLWRSGMDFWKTGVGLRPSDIALWMLRLQEASDCIPHPFHMYTSVFSTLICYGWAYGSTLTLLCLCSMQVRDGF